MTSKGILKSVFGSTAQGDGQLDTDWVILSCPWIRIFPPFGPLLSGDKGGMEGQASGELRSSVANGGLEGDNGGSYGGKGRELGVVEENQLGKKVGMVGEDLRVERKEGTGCRREGVEKMHKFLNFFLVFVEFLRMATQKNKGGGGGGDNASMVDVNRSC
ncbi:oligomeric Golgi complex subunit 5-like [Pyrus ussuriensis x Pyrus communis]|uniref:Oligomeric Golgi complex subunit 5-like n=1 Tax=Pyrus ussuriensis x Pyrus communis TaxID=2448454 RepID=A0A5N5FES8_9ROSA|nr:oligomeric Golgi complex subunit 5-like [Pyrus ussuriensis x Pyrus communis]